MPTPPTSPTDAPVSKTKAQRDAMVLTAARWLPQRGMAAVNLIEVARAVDAPRGSIYHYFPGGRDQLLQEALALASQSGLRMIEKAARAAATPQAFVRSLFASGARQINNADFSGGCPVGAAVLSSETENASFQRALQQSFAQWEAAIAQSFTALGVVPKSRTKTLARCALMAYEGALVCAKGARDEKLFAVAACMVEVMLERSDD